MTDATPPPVDPPLLELTGVKAAYGRIEVLHGVDLTVPRGSVVALLGPNGGGKTTTLKVISGQMAPTSGCVHIAGRHVNGMAPHRLAKAGVCTLPEGRGIFPNLTVTENLRLLTYGGQPFEHIETATFAAFPNLATRRDQVAGTLSGGEQQMLAMARCVSSQPALLLLDELSSGLAPQIVERLYDVVRDLARRGTSVLLVEQFTDTALTLADEVVMLSRGTVVFEGAPSTVTDEQLSAAYLGHGADGGGIR